MFKGIVEGSGEENVTEKTKNNLGKSIPVSSNLISKNNNRDEIYTSYKEGDTFELLQEIEFLTGNKELYEEAVEKKKLENKKFTGEYYEVGQIEPAQFDKEYRGEFTEKISLATNHEIVSFHKELVSRLKFLEESVTEDKGRMDSLSGQMASKMRDLKFLREQLGRSL